jgi:cation:H+ antiporter
MLIIATTRLSKAPLRGLDVSSFKLDKIFLFITAIVSAVLFFDGYNYLDGFIFAGIFVAYFIMALREMKIDKNKELLSSISNKNNGSTRQNDGEYKNNDKNHATREATTTAAATAGKSEPDLINVKENFQDVSKAPRRRLINALLIFIAGIVGILIGAAPFIHSLEGVSIDIGISAIVLSVIISPIAGEMPEKLSLMILARKGAHGASIATSNVLGSKILNNTLLLAIAVFGAIYHGGFYSTIGANTLLSYQMILVTVVTIAALIPMLKKEIGLRVGMVLLGLYIVSLIIQFFLPHQTQT